MILQRAPFKYSRRFPCPVSSNTSSDCYPGIYTERALFPFPVEKNRIISISNSTISLSLSLCVCVYIYIYIQSPKRKLPLCLCDRLLFSETTISIRGSCFSSIYFHGKQTVLCTVMSQFLQLPFSVLTDFISIHKISSVYMF